MLESSKKYRAHFTRPNGQQKWFNAVRSKLTINEISTLCNCSERTIRDWQKGKFHMDYECLDRVCRELSLLVPKVKKVDQFAHTKIAGKLGGEAVMEKYGKVPVNESVRKESWRAWWNEEGSKRSLSILQSKEIGVPRKSSKLAEFVGIMMGDGTIAPYHIAITLNSKDDLVYSRYVKELIKDLFKVTPKIYQRKEVSALNVVVARKQIVDFLHSLGLPKGNKIKQGLSVPEWILKNDQYARACLRGLMDTDGSVFDHSYKSKNKTYSYKKLSFTSASPALLKDVLSILESNKIVAHAKGRNVRIGSKEDVDRYFKIIGSSNVKHLKRLSK